MLSFMNTRDNKRCDKHLVQLRKNYYFWKHVQTFHKIRTYKNDIGSTYQNYKLFMMNTVTQLVIVLGIAMLLHNTTQSIHQMLRSNENNKI